MSDNLADILDFEVSVPAMSKALTDAGQLELLRMLSRVAPERVSRRCIYVVDAAARCGLPNAEVDRLFAIAKEIDD